MQVHLLHSESVVYFLINNMKNEIFKLIFWICALACAVVYAKFVYWELTEDIPTDENIWICGNHCWYDLRWKNLKEWKLEDHISDVTKKVEPKPIIKAQIKPLEQRKEVKPTNDVFDLDKFAHAVARHETSSCTKWFWKEYNNCFGLKNGRIAPCKKIGRLKMCIYDTPEESYEAFKKIWTEWYGGKFPTYGAAKVYSGNDRASTWLANVTKFYNN